MKQETLGTMTYKEAAQSALDCQNGCNASGIIRSLAECTLALWDAANERGLGSRWVNRHPVITLYLCKIGELNGASISSMSPCYEPSEKACQNIVAGGIEPDYRRLDWEVSV